MNKGRVVSVLWAWNDLLLSLLGCLLVAIFLISQPKKAKDDKTDESAGSISVFVFWPDSIDLDIDTHLSDPSGEHVFYGHKSGKVWDLLRDDLGTINDPTPRNFENAYARSSGQGHYVVNVAAYRGAPGLYPAEVDVEVRISGPPQQTADPLVLHRKVILDRTGEEVTAFRFDVGSDGHVVPDSVNSIYQPLAVTQ